MPTVQDENKPTSTELRYLTRARELGRWLLASQNKEGGSAAYRWPLFGWADPYPETTGYLIPTLLALGSEFEERRFEVGAASAADWLLRIQLECGAWPAGQFRRGRRNPPSIFNTGQVITGMVAMFEATESSIYLDSASRAAQWMGDQVLAEGLWPGGDYGGELMPSYYSHAASPMLKVWQHTGATAVRSSAEAVLDAIALRGNDNGTFDHWGFQAKSMAPTHTIAYTLKGFLEAYQVTGKEIWLKKALLGVEHLVRKTEFTSGRLPGSFDQSWNAGTQTVCLTGNAQIALCALALDEREEDLRLVNASMKLMDVVLRAKNVLLGSGVGGSHPLWGPYMRFRYPNWSAKYTVDALLVLVNRIRRERSSF